MGDFFYYRKQKRGLAVELWNRERIDGTSFLEIKAYDNNDGILYMSPTRARNLLKMLQEALEKMPDKHDGDVS